MYPQSQAAPKIFALPPELLEETLVITAAQGFPSAIAAFGRTCRHFHHLISCSADDHLWREVFLTTFDDPRPVLRKLRTAATNGPGAGDIEVTYGWAKEFQGRVKAARLFRELDNAAFKAVDLFSGAQEDDSASLTAALATILSVLETAAPFPSHHTEPMTSETSFPPLVSLRASSDYPLEFTSPNTNWVDKLFTHGYPLCLVRKYLLAGHKASKPFRVTEDHLCSSYPEEGKLFSQLVFRRGFIPVTSSPKNDVLQSSEDQNVAAREVARSQVYNLRYLRPERSWGPFLPARGSIIDARVKPKPRATFPDFERELSRYMLSNYIQDDTSDSEDEDFVPIDDDKDDGETNDGETDDGVPHIPRPHEVVPDYTYLAAARLLVDMNLREALITDEPMLSRTVGTNHQLVDALASLDFGRMGGAPEFWNSAWADQQPQTGNGGCIPLGLSPRKLDRKGKGKATDIEWIEGWDWAGAAGHWIRVVCWLDYRDLLLHNLHGYNGDDISETIHFFPMDLRVLGYSKPPEPDGTEIINKNALVWKLPVIHVVGEQSECLKTELFVGL
ncbi:hypothetical protein H0H87_004942 [Tephrocybe sp. NHM501043]|nr:hypothetical protein H0H87_004942 [Tephrocybe sp. NHM501043]